MPPKLLIDALGAVVRIDLEGLSESDAAAVVDVWRDATAGELEPVPEPVEGPTVVPDRSSDRASMLEALSQQVTLAAIEHRRGDFWMLHAAGMAAGDGRVVVLVGPSGRGKTTAARTLGASFAYVSDETVAIDDEGRVWPYRKPLSVIENGAYPKAQRSPSELGLQPLPDAALQVAAIVLLDRRDDASDEAVLEDVELGEALEDLVAQSSYLTAMPAPLQSITALATAAGGIRRVTYREASSLPTALEALLAAPAPARPGGTQPPADGEPAQPPADGVPAQPAGRVGSEAPVSRPAEPIETSAPRYSRTPYVDAIDLPDPDRIAVLHAAQDGAGSLHVLAGIAPAIWRAARAATLLELTAAAVSAYGEPPGDAATVVAHAIDELVDVGVLAVDHLWRIRGDVAWTGRDDRVVLLSMADSEASPAALEGSAALIWCALDATEWRATDEVVSRVVADSGAARESVAADVLGFLDELDASGFIERS